LTNLRLCMCHLHPDTIRREQQPLDASASARRQRRRTNPSTPVGAGS
jgi:hypothetical protein